jgi:hypothetical protein
MQKSPASMFCPILLDEKLPSFGGDRMRKSDFCAEVVDRSILLYPKRAPMKDGSCPFALDESSVKPDFAERRSGRIPQSGLGSILPDPNNKNVASSSI